MKSKIVLSSLLAALSLSCCQGKTAMLSEGLYKAAGGCIKQFQSVPEDVMMKTLSYDYKLSSKDEKCLANCFLTNSGLIKNNKVSVGFWNEMINIHWQEKVHQEIAQKNILDCIQHAVNESEPCEYAAKVLNCFFFKNQKNNLPPPHPANV